MRALLVMIACLTAGPALGSHAARRPVAGEAARSEPVEFIPLRRGYYVSADTACADASRATVMLFKGNGFNLTCRTRSIERRGDAYRLSETCSDHQGGADFDTVADYVPQSYTAFTVRGADGWEHSARFCEQAQMPAPFNTNDISDITG